LVEAVKILLNPCAFVFRIERGALNLAGSATYNQLIVPNNDWYVGEDMIECFGEADWLQFILGLFAGFRQIPCPLYADFMRSIEQAQPECFEFGV
jgi:hypothetical protein